MKFKKTVKRILRFTGLYTSREYRLARKEIEEGIDYSKQSLFGRHNTELLFIHIPKAAGISVVEALYGTTASCHATALDYKNEDASKFNNAFVVSLVRHPLTRLVSAYNYLYDGGRCEIDEVWRERYIKPYADINDFVKCGLKLAIQERAEHFIPQTEFLYEGNRLIVDHVGRLEQIDSFSQFISQKTNREIRLDKHSNASQRIFGVENLNDESIATIHILYEKDFHNFYPKQCENR